MRINTHGNFFSGDVSMEDFVCDKCGCEFSAVDDEYYIDSGGADGDVAFQALRAVISDYLVCSCPECHKIIKKIRTRQNRLLTFAHNEATPLNVTTAQQESEICMSEGAKSVSTGDL